MRVVSKALIFFWVTTIMVASTCFGADVHYCQNEVQSFNVFDVAKPCNMHKKKPVEIAKKKLPPCCQAKKKAEKKPPAGTPVIKNASCCYNDQVAFKTDGEQHVSTVDIENVDIQQIHFFNAEDQASSWDHFSITNPPFRGPPDVILRRNYQILFQVFLI